jgi:hypothetical protein
VVGIAQIVDDDPAGGRFAVHRSAFTSLEVLDGERELIFEASWLYVGHESFGIQIRTMWPPAPGHTEIAGWQLTPSDATDEVHGYRMTNAMTLWGPAGLATPDDIDALEQCQCGFAAEREAGYSDLSRGIGKPDTPGGGELPQRAFWRAWSERINGVPYVREGDRRDRSYLAGVSGDA